MRSVAIAIALLAGPLPVPTAMAQAYLAQPGDVLRLSVAGLAEAGVIATIDMDGQANFLQFGVVDVRDRSLEEIQRDIRRRADGLVIKRFASDGLASFVTLGAEDVFVDFASFQPVYVSGDVVSPRSIDFRPGLTLRAAVAAAGGPSRRLAVPAEDFSRVVPRLQSEFATVAIEHASQVARLWALEAELAGDRAPPDPDAGRVSIGAALFADMVASERRRLTLAFDRLDGQRAFLEVSLVQAKARRDILLKQGENQQSAVDADEEEQRRVSSLIERGVAPLTRMLEVRRVLLLSSTRLLDTENNLARVDLEITNLERQIRALDEERARTLNEERAAAQQRVLTAAARLTAVRELLEASGAAPLAPGAGAQAPITSYTLHRRIAGVPTSGPADPDKALLPGDVIEVTVVLPDLAALP